MRLRPTTKRRLVRLSLAASLLGFCVGCATPVRVGVECPMPTAAEVDDYDLVVADDEARSDLPRPVVVWVSRLIAYCWPNLSELERWSDE